MQRIFIGDVQGCAREFRRLVTRVRERLGADCEVCQIGDLVNKGPENLQALEIMREEMAAGRGRFVLGNHELHLIRVLAGIEPLFPGDSLGDVVESREASDWLEWLRARPLVEAFSIGDTHALMVHAAVHPLWTLPECMAHAGAIAAVLSSPDSDPWIDLLGHSDSDLAAGTRQTLRDDLARFTTCRGVDPCDPDRWESRAPTAPWTAWHAAWRLQSHDYGIVFGHWAQRGLVVAPGLRGLDTGCVYERAASAMSGGGRLTAWLPDPTRSDPAAGLSPFDCPDDAFWSEFAEASYLSGSEPYTFRPEPERRGIGVAHGAVVGSLEAHTDPEVVVVSGLPRSGTSMLMQMLRAGDVPVLVDHARPADADNPRGYFEWEAVKRIREDDSWIDDAVGRAVKVVAPLLPDLPDRHRYAIVFCQRDIEEVLASQAVMLRRIGRAEEAAGDDTLGDVLERELVRVVAWLESAPNVRALFLDHAEVVLDPLDAALTMDAFLGGGYDARAMAAEVEPALNRQRKRGVGA